VLKIALSEDFVQRFSLTRRRPIVSFKETRLIATRLVLIFVLLMKAF